MLSLQQYWGLVETHLSLAMFWGFQASLSLSFLIFKRGEMRGFKISVLEDMGQQELPFIVGWVQTDPSSLENYLQMSPKVKSKPTVGSSNSTLRCITYSNGSLCSPEDMHNIHSNCNHNSPKLEINQIPTSSGIDFSNDLFICRMACDRVMKTNYSSTQQYG